MMDMYYDELLALRKQVTRLEAQLADAQDEVKYLTREITRDTVVKQARLWRKLEASFIHADSLDWYDSNQKKKLLICREVATKESLSMHCENATSLGSLVEKWYCYCVEEKLIVGGEVSE